MEATKPCTTCKEIKQLTYYYKSSASKDGYKLQCKECIKKQSEQYQKSYYKANKNSIQESVKLYKEKYVHPKYGTWAGMKSRCNNKNHKHYYRYGGRGIYVSKEFIFFKDWLLYVSKLKHYNEEGYTLDRIDNDRNYEEGNIRWAKKSIQSSNRVKLSKSNTSGYKGVFKDRGKYRARIMVQGDTKSIVCGKSALECAIAYDEYIRDNNLPHTLNF